MRLICALLITALATPALAQQQPPPAANASELALQIDNAVNSMAQTILQQAKEIEQLKKDLAAKSTPPANPPDSSSPLGHK